MKLAALFSGGKDSTMAVWKAVEAGHSVECLVTLVSANPESYMFHTPNIWLAELQAEAMGKDLVVAATEGRKEEELGDMEAALRKATERFGVEGVVTGAVASAYQLERVKRVCGGLGLECVNPLWGIDQRKLLECLLAGGFRVMVSGVFAWPLGRDWLGREIDGKAICEISRLQDRYRISPAGEGGEFETTVLDAPLFGKRLEIVEAESMWYGDSGVYVVRNAVLRPKNASGTRPNGTSSGSADMA
jgi:diphthine-ammonia ligase